MPARLAFVLALLAAGCATDEPPGSVAPEAEGPVISENTFEITDAYTRAAPAGGVSAMFFQIENATASADTLVSARTDASDDVQIHRTVAETDGMTRMDPVESVPVPADETVALEPGGLHVMLLDLKRDLAVGDSLLVEMDFTGRGTLIVRVPVRPAS